MSTNKPISNNKCARKFDHLWEVERKTRTHVVKVCKYCKGRQWTCRRM